MKKFSLFCSAALLLLLSTTVSAQRPDARTSVSDLYGLKIESGDSLVFCRTIPFLAAPVSKRENTVRVRNGADETIPVGSPARTLYLLGMINDGWDSGLAHWGEHFELRETREDQVQIGTSIGEIEIRYADGSSDRIPMIVGSTIWFFNQWKNPSHNAGRVIREPFASRPEYMQVLRDALQVRETGEYMEAGDSYRAYYLPVTPRELPIESIVVHNNTEKRGEILISGITLQLPRGAKPTERLTAFGKRTVMKGDLQPAFATDDIPDFGPKLEALSDILYTSLDDLPKKVERIDFPQGFKGTGIRFLSDSVEGDMLSNIWVANLTNIDEKFDPATGCFYETGVGSPFYGGYQGIGTWEPIGIYREPYSRTLGSLRAAGAALHRQPATAYQLRGLLRQMALFLPGRPRSAERTGQRADRRLQYPKDAPPHWAFVMNGPAAIPYEINEIPGDEEMEGHSSTIVSRWFAWKQLGKPTGEWLTETRDSVYRKSRWQSTKDATDFICWLLDYTGRDVVYSEGEFTGWAAKFSKISQIPKNMDTETDPRKIRDNYANCDMYEVYASYTSMTALLCSAEMAEAMGDTALAEKYRAYAGAHPRRNAANAGRRAGSRPDVARSPQLRAAEPAGLPGTGLVLALSRRARPAADGRRPNADHASHAQTPTEPTLRRYPGARHGIRYRVADPLGAGARPNGQCRTAAGQHRPLHVRQKHEVYADSTRGIDWRKWMWIIPEGANIMPDGRWYRICDLSNGANQGPAMNALEICAGVDDSRDDRVRLLPRIPDPLNGLEVTGARVMTRSGDRLESATIDYAYRRGQRFTLRCDKPVPALDIRFGPYTGQAEADRIAEAVRAKGGADVRVERSGRLSRAAGLLGLDRKYNRNTKLRSRNAGFVIRIFHSQCRRSRWAPVFFQYDNRAGLSVIRQKTFDISNKHNTL